MIDITFLEHFHFLRPYWFLAFIAIFLILRYFSQRDDSLVTWRKIMSPEILHHLTVKGNASYWLSPKKLTWFIALPLTLLLMGPTWQQQPSPFSENNAILVIALDVSQTMLQDDVQPSRLLRAKQKILQLLAIRGDTKTALIAFSGSAHIVMPVTDDQAMIQHFLDVLEPNLMPVPGKLPQSILPLVNDLLATSTIPGTLLLIGDGATSETDTLFADFFNRHTDQLIVWAIGKTAPKASDKSNSTNIIPLQINQLQSLANNSHVRLVSMTADQTDVLAVNRFIKHNLVIVEDKSRPWHDAGYPLIFIIALLYLFWFRKGWTLQW